MFNLPLLSVINLLPKVYYNYRVGLSFILSSSAEFYYRNQSYSGKTGLNFQSLHHFLLKNIFTEIRLVSILHNQNRMDSPAPR